MPWAAPVTMIPSPASCMNPFLSPSRVVVKSRAHPGRRRGPRVNGGRRAARRLPALAIGFRVLVLPLARALAEEPPPETLPREVALDRLDARGPWRIRKLEIEGVGWIRAWLLRSGVTTETRPFWAFWRERPEFSPHFLQADLERLRRELEAEGYYSAAVEGRITVIAEPSGRGMDRKPGLVDAKIVITEGEPVRVCRLDIAIASRDIPASDFAKLRERLPLHVGDVFAQQAYQDAAA